MLLTFFKTLKIMEYVNLLRAQDKQTHVYKFVMAELGIFLSAVYFLKIIFNVKTLKRT